MQKAKLQTVVAISALVFTLNASAHYKHNDYTQAAGTETNLQQEVQVLRDSAPNLDPKVLRLALTAYSHAHRLGMDAKEILTVIDYHLPDFEKRMWVIDLKHNHVLYNTYVAHGQESGSVYANHFSNQPGTHASSLGLYLTSNTYFGDKGLALRLDGLDKGFNDNALSRAIVIHGAWYVDPKLAEQYGRIGRSWGCPAVSRTDAQPIINTIKNGTLVFAYAPDYSWLHSSRYLSNA